MTSEDFYAEDVTQDIEIAVTYSSLNAEAKGLFSTYIDNEKLTVVRVFSDPQSGKAGTYHGMRLQNPDFVPIRSAGPALAMRSKYNEIRGRKSTVHCLPSLRRTPCEARWPIGRHRTQNNAYH